MKSEGNGCSPWVERNIVATNASGFDRGQTIYGWANASGELRSVLLQYERCHIVADFSILKSIREGTKPDVIDSVCCRWGCRAQSKIGME